MTGSYVDLVVTVDELAEWVATTNVGYNADRLTGIARELITLGVDRVVKKSGSTRAAEIHDVVWIARGLDSPSVYYPGFDKPYIQAEVRYPTPPEPDFEALTSAIQQAFGPRTVVQVLREQDSFIGWARRLAKRRPKSPG